MSKYKGGWRISLRCAAVPGLIFLLGSFFLPDTPNSLIERGKHEEAKTVLQKIRGIPDVDEEYNDLIAASEESQKVNHPWANIRPQLTFALCIPFFQQFTGINVIMFYAPVLFKTLGSGATASLVSAVITGLVNFLLTLISSAVVDTYGRRVVFLEGGIQMLACQVLKQNDDVIYDFSNLDISIYPVSVKE